MNRILIAVFLLCSAGLAAQGDLGSKSATIAPSGSLAPKTTTVAPKTATNFDTPIPDDSPLVEDKPIDLTLERHFANPNDQYTKRLQSKMNEVAPVREKQALGTVRTKKQRVIVRYRDSQEVDGDQVQVSHNGNRIINRATLGGNYGGFELRLESGYNYIDFKVLDEGSSGPNTAAYEVVDLDGNVLLSSLWDLSLSDVASLVIIWER